MIIVNGCPKSGTHALLKAVELLGRNTWDKDVSHIPYKKDAPKMGYQTPAKHCLIKRDPRDMLVSWMRFQGKSLTDGIAISILREGSWISMLKSYTGWLGDSNVKVFSFEELIATDLPMRELAEYLQVPYIESAFPNLFGMTKTWTGTINPMIPSFSDHRKIWTAALQEFWLEIGGASLMEDYGY